MTAVLTHIHTHTHTHTHTHNSRKARSELALPDTHDCCIEALLLAGVGSKESRLPPVHTKYLCGKAPTRNGQEVDADVANLSYVSCGELPTCFAAKHVYVQKIVLSLLYVHTKYEA